MLASPTLSGRRYSALAPEVDAGAPALPPPPVIPTADGADLAVGFAHGLRLAGIRVPLTSVLAFVDALAAVGIDERNAVYWAGRATLLHRIEDLPLFDRAFGAFWEQSTGIDIQVGPVEHLTLALDAADEDERVDDSDEDDDDDDGTEDLLSVRWSDHEVLRDKDFAAYTHDELAESHRFMAELRLAGALRQARRLRPAPAGRGTTLDLRRTVRAALATAGEPIHRPTRKRRHKPRRIVLLCDVSGSMEAYARVLLRFLHATVVAKGAGKVEAFAFGTRLTRLTRELVSHDPDAAMAAAAKAVPDWSGGTRLGESLRQFNDRWGVRGMARGAVVVILSDGWDRGDPDVLGEQVARLHRVAHRVVWVNPLKHTPGYAPLARGMAAALPYVDDFIEGHSLASLEALASVVSKP